MMIAVVTVLLLAIQAMAVPFPALQHPLLDDVALTPTRTSSAIPEPAASDNYLYDDDYLPPPLNPTETPLHTTVLMQMSWETPIAEGSGAVNAPSAPTETSRTQKEHAVSLPMTFLKYCSMSWNSCLTRIQWF